MWFYELDWVPPVDGGKWGSPHSLDLAMGFDNVALSAYMVGTGPEPQAVAPSLPFHQERIMKMLREGWDPARSEKGSFSKMWEERLKDTPDALDRRSGNEVPVTAT